MKIYSATPIVPGESCLYASRKVWEEMMSKLPKTTQAHIHIKRAMDASDKKMIKVSMKPELAAYVERVAAGEPTHT